MQYCRPKKAPGQGFVSSESQGSGGLKFTAKRTSVKEAAVEMLKRPSHWFQSLKTGRSRAKLQVGPSYFLICLICFPRRDAQTTFLRLCGGSSKHENILERTAFQILQSEDDIVSRDKMKRPVTSGKIQGVFLQQAITLKQFEALLSVCLPNCIPG